MGMCCACRLKHGGGGAFGTLYLVNRFSYALSCGCGCVSHSGIVPQYGPCIGGWDVHWDAGHVVAPCRIQTPSNLCPESHRTLVNAFSGHS